MKLFSIFIFAFGMMISSLLEAACPVTHVYFSKKYFRIANEFTPEEQKLFIVGTLFPDIRYLGEGERADTHFDHVSLEEVVEEKEPFMAGVKFHSWLDARREEFVREFGIYDKIEAEGLTAKITLLKFIEDELYFSSSLWTETISATGAVCMGAFPEQYSSFSIGEAEVRKWNKILFLYFLCGPAKSLQLLQLSGKTALGLSKEEIYRFSHNLKALVQKEEFIEWGDKLSERIEALLVEEKKLSTLP